MQKTLKWGIVGTGGIASDFAEALLGSQRGRVVNVVGTSPAKAEAFAQKWKLTSSSATLQQMLADKNVEAVYVASPHPAHEAQAIACIEAGKHVLCEKPCTIDAASTERVIEAARRRGVFLMEAFMYRCHPQIGELLSRLRQGAIGEIRHVRADFGFRVPRNPEGRLFKLELGGGGILDVGGYPMSFARLIAGFVEGKPFAEPVRLEASGFIGPTGADELATALVWFGSGLTAELTCAVHHDVGTAAVVFGEAGKIVLPNPWIPAGRRQGRESAFTVFRDGRDPETVPIRTTQATYAIEADLVADTLPRFEPAPPAMTWADTLGNMRALDRWRGALASSRQRG
jgi:predicted dehydrogenase